MPNCWATLQSLLTRKFLETGQSGRNVTLWSKQEKGEGMNESWRILHQEQPRSSGFSVCSPYTKEQGDRACLLSFGSQAFVFILGCSDNFYFLRFCFSDLKNVLFVVEGNKDNDFSGIQGVYTALGWQSLPEVSSRCSGKFYICAVSSQILVTTCTLAHQEDNRASSPPIIWYNIAHTHLSPACLEEKESEWQTQT